MNSFFCLALSIVVCFSFSSLPSHATLQSVNRHENEEGNDYYDNEVRDMVVRGMPVWSNSIDLNEASRFICFCPFIYMFIHSFWAVAPKGPMTHALTHGANKRGAINAGNTVVT